MTSVIMKVKKSQLLCLTCMGLPVVGFAVMCLGASLVSLQTNSTLKNVLMYGTICLGFLAMLVGVFWTLCNSMKSKMYQRTRREQRIQIFTIERPSSFPPSYEESQRRQACPDHQPDVAVVVDRGDMMMSLAPPLYNQDSSEAPDCTWSWEQPPQYAEVVHIQHELMDTRTQREAIFLH